MKKLRFTARHIWKNLLIGILAVTIVAPPLLMPLAPQTAYAQNSSIISNISGGLMGIAACVTGMAAMAGLALEEVFSVPTAETGPPNETPWQNCLADPIIWMLKNIFIDELVESLMDWVRSGFDGTPTFVNDLDGFLLGVADKAAGHWLADFGLGFLCEPFQIDLQLNLAVTYYGRYGEDGTDTYCTLSDMVENIEDFIGGNFYDGGLPAFAEMSLYPTGNPMGSLLTAQGELAVKISAQEDREFKLLDFGAGWLSLRDENGNVVTPGHYVLDEIQHHTGASLDELISADELDEMISEVGAYLVQALLTGAQGLLGSESYYDDARDRGNELFEEARTDLLAKIDALIASETTLGCTEFLTALNDLRTRLLAISLDDPQRLIKLSQIRNELAIIQMKVDARGGGCTPAALAVTITADETFGDVPLTVNLVGNATGGTTDPYSYSWDFGDGSPAVTDKETSHTYSTAGTYTVTLTVTQGTLTGSATVTVTVTDDLPPGPGGPPSGPEDPPSGPGDPP